MLNFLDFDSYYRSCKAIQKATKLSTSLHSLIFLSIYLVRDFIPNAIY